MSKVIIDALKAKYNSYGEDKKKAFVKKYNTNFLIDISDEKEKYTIDLKNGAGLIKQGQEGKPDVTLIMENSVFKDICEGKLNGQKAFMAGKLKVKGNMMKSTKIGDFLKEVNPASKL